MDAQGCLINATTFNQWTASWTPEERRRRQLTQYLALIAASGHELGTIGRFQMVFKIGLRMFHHEMTVLDDNQEHSLHDIDLLLGWDFCCKYQAEVSPTSLKIGNKCTCRVGRQMLDDTLLHATGGAYDPAKQNYFLLIVQNDVNTCRTLRKHSKLPIWFIQQKEPPVGLTQDPPDVV
jgi:hypothetical protein